MRLGQPQGDLPRELNELGANHHQVVELPPALGTHAFSIDFDSRPSFRNSFTLRSRTFSLSESASL